MSIQEFGIRVDSLRLLREMSEGTFHPKNETDRLVYSKMLEWSQAFDYPLFKYVYYGREFCGKLFPRPKEWREIASYCQENKKTLVMLIPPANDEIAERVINIVCDISRTYNPSNLEISVNDFGILETLNRVLSFREKPLIRLGRVLDKTYHDGRLDSGEITTMYENCRMRWMEDKVWVPILMEKVLQRYQVQGIDIDMPALTTVCETKTASDLSIGMFVPYCYTTTGGVCKMRQIGVPYSEKIDSRISTCDMYCMKYYERMHKRVIDIHKDSQSKRNGSLYKSIEMYRVGNTVFYNRQYTVGFANNVKGIDRLIFEPKMML